MFVLSNFFFCHYVLESRLLQRPESVYMKERVNLHIVITVSSNEILRNTVWFCFMNHLIVSAVLGYHSHIIEFELGMKSLSAWYSWGAWKINYIIPKLPIFWIKRYLLLICLFSEVKSLSYFTRTLNMLERHFDHGHLWHLVSWGLVMSIHGGKHTRGLIRVLTVRVHVRKHVL